MSRAIFVEIRYIWLYNNSVKQIEFETTSNERKFDGVERDWMLGYNIIGFDVRLHETRAAFFMSVEKKNISRFCAEILIKSLQRKSQ